MSLTESQLRELSSLIDTLQSLPRAAQVAWLAELPAAQGIYRPTLERLLEREAKVETADFLLTLPKLDDVATREDNGLVAGMAIGPYRVIRELGAGGMGEVWLAERADGVLKRSVALKLPMLSLKRSVLVQRFERERDILATLTHPNIARLYDAGFTETGQPYLALEYVEGEPITDFASTRKLDTQARIGLLLQVMDAVQYAHAHLVIHRDLKPANVLVSSDGKVHLLDFGIAKLLEEEVSQADETELTRLGGRALTLSYAAPEQVTGSPVSTATDVYALGVLLYEVLTQSRPFNGSRHELEHAILNDEPPRPKGLAADLANVLLKALKKNPMERYATVSGFATDLDNWLRGKPVSAQPDKLGYRMRKFVGRNRLGVASAVLVSCALVAATAVSLWQASIAKRQSQTAAAVEKFLLDIFKTNSSLQTDPEKARKTTARELLDIGARRIATEMQDAPHAKVRILDNLAELYDELTLVEPSLELRRQRVQLLRTIESNDSVDLAVALGQFADRAVQASAREEAEKAFAEAFAILDKRGDFETKQRGDLEAELAGSQLFWGDPKAIDTAKRAAEILKKFPPSTGLLWILEVLAFQALGTGDAETSLKLAREALTLAPAVPDLKPNALVGLNLSLARALQKNSQTSAAERAMREAHSLAVEKMGPDSQFALNAAMTLGRLYQNYGEYLKALDVYLPAVRSAQTMLDRGERNWVNLIAIAEYGVALVRAGRINEGLKVIQMTQKARDILDSHPPMDAIVRTNAAEAYALGGAHALAQGEIEALGKLIGTAKMEADRGVVDRFQRTERLGAVMRSDVTLLRSLIAKSKLAEAPPNETPSAAFSRLAQLSEALFVTGDLEAALAAATQLIDTLPKSKEPTYDGDVERRGSLVAGKVHVLHKQPAEAIKLLHRAVSLADGRLDTQMSPQHADALIWLGMAQVAAGRGQEARQLAKQAQQIHERHPLLADAFRKPLANLNARLRA